MPDKTYSCIKLLVNDNSNKSLIVMSSDAYERLTPAEKANTMTVEQR